jgi:hypothetical protein
VTSTSSAQRFDIPAAMRVGDPARTTMANVDRVSGVCVCVCVCVCSPAVLVWWVGCHISHSPHCLIPLHTPPRLTDACPHVSIWLYRSRSRALMPSLPPPPSREHPGRCSRKTRYASTSPPPPTRLPDWHHPPPPSSCPCAYPQASSTRCPRAKISSSPHQPTTDDSRATCSQELGAF